MGTFDLQSRGVLIIMWKPSPKRKKNRVNLEKGDYYVDEGT